MTATNTAGGDGTHRRLRRKQGFVGVSGLSHDKLKGLSDPVGSLIGAKAQGPCNGVALAGAVRLTGDALAAKPFGAPDRFSSLPDGVEFEMDSGVLTDEANHDTSVCGHVARTQVFLSVIRIPEYSLHKDYHLSVAASLTDGRNCIHRRSERICRGR